MKARRPSAPLLISILTLVIALGGTSYAVAVLDGHSPARTPVVHRVTGAATLTARPKHTRAADKVPCPLRTQAPKKS